MPPFRLLHIGMLATALVGLSACSGAGRRTGPAVAAPPLEPEAAQPDSLADAAGAEPAPYIGAQSLQIHYDLRHTTDPVNNPQDFPSLTFKSFRGLEFGSFLLKMEADLNGSRGNVSQVYTEITQTLKFWEPPVFLHLQYTGGLGLFEFDGGVGGYHLDNAYLAGAARPFPWMGGWGSAYLAYRHTNTPDPSHDLQFALYWGRTFGNGLDIGSTVTGWTQDRNRGDEWTAGQSGKRASVLIETQLWYGNVGRLSVGTETNVSYNVYVIDGRVKVYPTLGVRYAF